LGREFIEYCRNEGILQELMTAYTPSQNGVSERKNRTLLEKARAMVSDARTPPILWTEATATANYVTNRSPTRASSGITPYQRLRGKKLDLSHLRIYGSIAWVHMNDECRTKLEPKSRKCLFVGYYEESKAYKCYDPQAQKILISKDVRFEEGIFPHALVAPSSAGISLEPLSDHSAAIYIENPRAYLDPSSSSNPSLEPILP
jgi:hypothetical protein